MPSLVDKYSANNKWRLSRRIFRLWMLWFKIVLTLSIANVSCVSLVNDYCFWRLAILGRLWGLLSLSSRINQYLHTRSRITFRRNYSRRRKQDPKTWWSTAAICFASVCMTSCSWRVFDPDELLILVCFRSWQVLDPGVFPTFVYLQSWRVSDPGGSLIYS